MEHERYCEGGHTEAISCADATAWRADVRADPWICHGDTRSGYHWFQEDRQPSDVCGHAGCTRTWAELQAALAAVDPDLP